MKLSTTHVLSYYSAQGLSLVWPVIKLFLRPWNTYAKNHGKNQTEDCTLTFTMYKQWRNYLDCYSLTFTMYKQWRNYLDCYLQFLKAAEALALLASIKLVLNSPLAKLNPYQIFILYGINIYVWNKDIILYICTTTISKSKMISASLAMW